MNTPAELSDRRRRMVEAWTAFVENGDAVEERVRPEIWRSWQRSSAAELDHEISHAPLDDESETRAYFESSPLQVAIERVEAELRRTAEDGDLVLAVTDEQTRILWTYGGRVMRRKAESVNFVAGGRWDEGSVGTNALNLALRHGNPSMVFSAEHYARSCTTGCVGPRPCTTPRPGANSA
jgi:transcriptional regulator of acetoin/glycerol metabolism